MAAPTSVSPSAQHRCQTHDKASRAVSSHHLVALAKNLMNLGEFEKAAVACRDALRAGPNSDESSVVATAITLASTCARLARGVECNGLLDFVRRRDELPRSTIKSLLTGIRAALRGLHARGRRHGGLSAGDVVVVVVAGDPIAEGVCLQLERGLHPPATISPSRWESADASVVSVESDWYSFGLLMYTLVTRDEVLCTNQGGPLSEVLSDMLWRGESHLEVAKAQRRILRECILVRFREVVREWADANEWVRALEVCLREERSGPLRALRDSVHMLCPREYALDGVLGSAAS